MTPTLVVLGARALIQLLELPFGTTCSHSIFGLAVVNAKGERAGLSNCSFAGQSFGFHCFFQYYSWLNYGKWPKVSPSSPLLYCFSYGSAQRSMPLFIPTADCTTGWRAPGWCDVESPFIEIAETVSSKLSTKFPLKRLYGQVESC